MSVEGINIYNSSMMTSNTTAKANELQNTLSSVENGTNEELMDACKSFESYFIEQVFRSMQKTVMKSENSTTNEYTEYFQDMLTQEYASSATKTGGYGIAQMLYESMKRN